ncbi:hypothetical protein NIES4101_51750 [Calothrix sp. NIES-4101]|nr:hypothetical protein NIES4101_51750 [Calothrix sp. NIES-4101]
MIFLINIWREYLMPTQTVKFFGDINQYLLMILNEWN